MSSRTCFFYLLQPLSHLPEFAKLIILPQNLTSLPIQHNVNGRLPCRPWWRRQLVQQEGPGRGRKAGRFPLTPSSPSLTWPSPLPSRLEYPRAMRKVEPQLLVGRRHTMALPCNHATSGITTLSLQPNCALTVFPFLLDIGRRSSGKCCRDECCIATANCSPAATDAVHTGRPGRCR